MGHKIKRIEENVHYQIILHNNGSEYSIKGDGELYVDKDMNVYLRSEDGDFYEVNKKSIHEIRKSDEGIEIELEEDFGSLKIENGYIERLFALRDMIAPLLA